MYLIGVNISIISIPVGTPVNESTNTFDYPILTNVSLLCMATTPDGLPIAGASYSWTATNCYNHTGDVQIPCFYSGGRTGNIIIDNSVLAPDAGIVTCTATIAGKDFISDTLTLRIAGKDIWYKATLFFQQFVCRLHFCCQLE